MCSRGHATGVTAVTAFARWQDYGLAGERQVGANRDQMATWAREVAWPGSVSIGPSQMNHNLERFAPHGLDDRFAFVVFRVKRQPELMHPVAGMIECPAALGEFREWCVHLLAMLVGAPGRKQIIERSFDRKVQHAPIVGHRPMRGRGVPVTSPGDVTVARRRNLSCDLHLRQI